MRQAPILLLLSTLVLLGVTGLTVLERSAPAPDAPVPTPGEARAAVPAVVPDHGPRLAAVALPADADGAGLRAEVARLTRQVAALEADLARVRAVLDPAADVLALLAEESPKILASRRESQETAAIATLRNLVSAQAQVQATARIDTDRDGVGEYGGFIEMSGAAQGRMGQPLVPPVLSSAFRMPDAHGEVVRSGYRFRIYLPGPRAGGEGEPQRGFADDGTIDADLAETTWCCYAWPAEAGGRSPTYFVNQAGDVLATDAPYAGAGGGPAWEAAFRRGGSIVGAAAIGETGADGNLWRQVN